MTFNPDGQERYLDISVSSHEFCSEQLKTAGQGGGHMERDTDFLHDWSPPVAVILLTVKLESSDQGRMKSEGVSCHESGFELFVTPWINVCVLHTT